MNGKDWEDDYQIMNGKECGSNRWKVRASPLGKLRKNREKSESGWVSKWMENTHRKLVAVLGTQQCVKCWASFRRNLLPPASDRLCTWHSSGQCQTFKQNLDCTAVNAYGRQV